MAGKTSGQGDEFCFLGIGRGGGYAGLAVAASWRNFEVVPVGVLGFPCWVCGSGRVRLFGVKQGVRFAGCKSCGLVWVADRPGEGEILAEYERLGEEYYLRPEHVEAMSGADYSAHLARLRGAAAGRDLLEIGCNLGFFLRGAQADGWNAVGVEASGAAARFARERLGLNVIHGTLAKARLPSGSFDVVWAWALMEHLADPRKELKEVARLLRGGGALVVAVPNRAGLSFRLLGKRYRYVDPSHLWYFGPKALRLLLEEAGFRVERMETEYLNPIAFWEDLSGKKAESFSTAARERSLREAARAKRTVWVVRGGWRVFRRFVEGMGLGDVLVATARKPREGHSSPS